MLLTAGSRQYAAGVLAPVVNNSMDMPSTHHKTGMGISAFDWSSQGDGSDTPPGTRFFITEKVLQSMSKTQAKQSEKVVVQFGNRVLKGYWESPAWDTIEELLGNAPAASPEILRIRHRDSDKVEEVLIQNVKAVFYVKTWEGDSGHNHLNFHSRAPVSSGIWVRLEFRDGELMEGIVYNSLRYLVDPGFFLMPTDPECNNRMVYVSKSWLVDHRVLGMRKI